VRGTSSLVCSNDVVEVDVPVTTVFVPWDVSHDLWVWLF
jgi:hypothetical protein